MKMSHVEYGSQAGRPVNAVALQNAVLCAECDVVSDSPHDMCLVCGSRSLLNMARMFGGNLPRDRASLVVHEPLEMKPRESVLTFPQTRQMRNKPSFVAATAIAGSRDNETDEVDGRVLFGSQG